MMDLALQNWPILLVALVIGLATAWSIWGRRTRIAIAPPTLDDSPPTPTLARHDGRADAPTRRPDPATTELTRLKGIGPRLAALLAAQGVTRIDQVATWTDDDVRAIDGTIGAFAGRAIRDQWVEQARLLAADNIAEYEARFGKIEGSAP